MTGRQVVAVGGARNNAELILQVAQLRYLRPEMLTVDPTFGLGRFWRFWRPNTLRRHDIDPKRAPDGAADFRRLPYAAESVDAVVFDGPYKLNGAGGSHPSDDGYGVANRESWQARHELLRAGITEAARIVRPASKVRVDRGRFERVGGVVVIKCQDQVCSGAVRWQTREFSDHAESVGLVLVDMLHLVGARPQPAGRTRKHGDCRGAGCSSCDGGRVPTEQHHASRNYSTLLVCQKAAR